MFLFLDNITIVSTIRKCVTCELYQLADKDKKAREESCIVSRSKTAYSWWIWIWKKYWIRILNFNLLLICYDMTIILFGIEDIIIGITHWHSSVLFAFDLIRDCRWHHYLLWHAWEHRILTLDSCIVLWRYQIIRSL